MTALETLKELLEVEVDKLVKQEDVVESIRGLIRLLEEGDIGSVRKPSVARLEDQPQEVSTRVDGPERQGKPADSRVSCNACGGRMEPSFRTLQSGKTVSYLGCTDSSCNNEQFMS